MRFRTVLRANFIREHDEQNMSLLKITFVRAKNKVSLSHNVTDTNTKSKHQRLFLTSYHTYTWGKQLS